MILRASNSLRRFSCPLLLVAWGGLVVAGGLDHAGGEAALYAIDYREAIEILNQEAPIDATPFPARETPSAQRFGRTVIVLDTSGYSLTTGR